MKSDAELAQEILETNSTPEERRKYALFHGAIRLLSRFPSHDDKDIAEAVNTAERTLAKIESREKARRD
jgi:hypothetical protein